MPEDGKSEAGRSQAAPSRKASIDDSHLQGARRSHPAEELMSVDQHGQCGSARQAVQGKCTAGDLPCGYQRHGEMWREVPEKERGHVQLRHLLTTKRTPIQIVEG